MPQPPEPNHRAALGAALAAALLLVAGVYVVWRLDQTQKAQACLESGGRRCAVIESSPSR